MADPTLFTTHVSQGLKRLLVQFQGQPNFEGQLTSFLNQVQEIEDMLYSLIVERYLDDAIGEQLDGIGRVVGELRLGKDDTDYRTALQGRIRSNRADSRVEDIHFLFSLLLPGFTFTMVEGTVASFLYLVDQRLTTALSGSPTVVFDSGGLAAFFDVAHGLTDGDTIIQTDFVRTEYNITGVVTLIDVDSYTIGLTFTGSSSGGGNWTRVADPSATVLDAQLQVAKGAGIHATLIYSNDDDIDNWFTYASGDVIEVDATQGYANDAGTTGGIYSAVV